METEHIQTSLIWSNQWEKLKTIEEGNTMAYTRLEIDVFPNVIRLIAKIANGENVAFPPIEKLPSKRHLVAPNLKHQLSWIRKHANTPILLPTINEFLVLYEFIPFIDLVGKYGIEVVGYTIPELTVKVKDYILNNDDPNHILPDDVATVCPEDYIVSPVTKNSGPIDYVDHIFYDNVATVVFWTDGTKTVVKCAEGTPYDEYSAFCIALAKKIYGNNSALKRAIKNHAKYSKKRQIEKKFNDAADNFEKVETENKIEEAVRKYINHIHKNLADTFQSNKEENKDA